MNCAVNFLKPCRGICIRNTTRCEAPQSRGAHWHCKHFRRHRHFFYLFPVKQQKCALKLKKLIWSISVPVDVVVIDVIVVHLCCCCQLLVIVSHSGAAMFLFVRRISNFYSQCCCCRLPCCSCVFVCVSSKQEFKRLLVARDVNDIALAEI